MKIAVIGTGIAGNVAAYKLRRDHDITVYESGNHVGGHTNTIDVDEDGRRLAVDTGFIVFNDQTYPNFIQLLDEIGQESDLVIVAGGTQVTDELARECGMDAGFGRGTSGRDVASFLVRKLRDDGN